MSKRTRQLLRLGRQGCIALALLAALTVQQVVVLGHFHSEFEGKVTQADAKAGVFSATEKVRATGTALTSTSEFGHSDACALCAMSAAAGSRNVAAAVFVDAPEFSRRERRLFAAFIAPGAPPAASFEARGPPELSA